MQHGSKPVYNKDRQKRVISGPKGFFVAQKKIAERGTKTSDNWEMIQRPTKDYNLAKTWATIE